MLIEKSPRCESTPTSRLLRIAWAVLTEDRGVHVTPSLHQLEQGPSRNALPRRVDQVMTLNLMRKNRSGFKTCSDLVLGPWVLANAERHKTRIIHHVPIVAVFRQPNHQSIIRINGQGP